MQEMGKFNMAAFGRKVSELIKKEKDTFIWVGASFDEIESIRVTFPQDYCGKGKYDFGGEIKVVQNDSEGGSLTKFGTINGKVYIEERKELKRSDIDDIINIQIR